MTPLSALEDSSVSVTWKLFERYAYINMNTILVLAFSLNQGVVVTTGYPYRPLLAHAEDIHITPYVVDKVSCSTDANFNIERFLRRNFRNVSAIAPCFPGLLYRTYVYHKRSFVSKSAFGHLSPDVHGARNTIYCMPLSGGFCGCFYIYDTNLS